MSSAFLYSLETPFKGSLAKTLEEVQDLQQHWIDRIEDQNKCLADTESQMEALGQLVESIPLYISKIYTIKRDVLLLNQRIMELKIRSQKLSQRRKELQLDREARLATLNPSVRKDN